MLRRFLYPLLVAILSISAFFVSHVPLKEAMWPVSVFAIILFSVPVFIGCIAWFGVRNGLLLMGLLGSYALLFETAAVVTGFPYGHFMYSGLLGPLLFATTPLTVLVAWSPLLLGVLSVLPTMSTIKQIGVGAVLMVMTDLVLDPAAVRLGFWQWPGSGTYYGVPVTNFIGWLLSGGIGIAIVIFFRRRYKYVANPKILQINFLLTIYFWLVVTIFFKQWVAAAIGVILLVLLSKIRQDGTLRRWLKT